MDDISLYIDHIIMSSFLLPVSSFSLPLQIVTVFTFRGGDNGKRGGGTVRHACFATAQRRLNICYSCADADFPLLSESIVTSGLGLMRKGKDLRLISYRADGTTSSSHSASS